MDLELYRQRAAEFTEAIGREHYNHFAGHKDDLEIESIYEQYADVFSRDAVEQLRELKANASEGDDLRSKRYLLEFAVGGYLGQASKELDVEIAQKEASLKIEVEGEQIGYRESAVLAANEADRARRSAIEAARTETVANELNPLLKQSLESAHDQASELGWSSYREMYEDLKGMDLAKLSEQVSVFLDASEESYPDALKRQVDRTLGIGLDELERHDFAWLFRASEFDSLFPEEKLVQSFQETLTGLGIDLSTQTNVHLDVERREKKSPRAFCAPVRVPEEIYLVVPPIGGRDDYQALMHEGGHTEHFAHVSRNLPFEFSQLGDNSVTEGFAFLFHYLTENPAWLRLRLGIEDTTELDAHARAQHLYFMRRYASKLRYELELHAGNRPLDELAGLYASNLSGATLANWPREMFLADVDPGYYAASYLRAWALELLLTNRLEERFGEEWFDVPAAGTFLKEMWSEGQRLNADELAEQYLGGELEFATAVAQFD